MTALERYDKGLITLPELAEVNPAVAIKVMHEEHRREFNALREKLTAIQNQLDAIIDMVYDRDKVT